MSRLTDKNDSACLWCVEDADCIGTCHLVEVYEKLRHYEDLEEQGRLIITKYAKGQTVYEVDTEIGVIEEYKVASSDVWHDVTSDNCDPWNRLDAFRENSPMVFATKEEAEAKLAELGGKA